VPFVARCTLRFEDGNEAAAMTVNVNALGAYIAADSLPRVGEALQCRFPLPAPQGEARATGRVVWVNPRAPRVAGALPVGFGLQFEALSEPERLAVERIVHDYLADSRA